MKIQQIIGMTAAAAVLSFVLGDFAHRAEGADAAEARLRKSEDVEAIQSLLVHYGRELDERDFKAYGALFAQDGSWKGGMGTATGPDAIAKMVAAGFERMSPALYENSVSRDDELRHRRERRHGDRVVALDLGRRRRRTASRSRRGRVTTRTRWSASAGRGVQARQAFTEINP